ncbi:MAG: acyltransferase family protein [Bacteroidales bacterium]|nr:acyltransferase family protein [Bacteroidales bacterium]
MTKMRQSGFELLRIVAMLLIVATHANTLSLGWMTGDDIAAAPGASLARMIIESMTMVSVTAFIIISGWFGIKPTWKKFGAFIFQCWFFAIGLFIAGLFVKGMSDGLSPAGGLQAALLLSDYWFIIAYLFLFLMAPVLNSFVDNSTGKQLGTVIILFFVFEFLFGWVNDSAVFVYGHTPITFIGPYLLGKYMRKYEPAFTKLNKLTDLCIFLTLSLLNAVIAMIAVRKGVLAIRFFSDTTPLIVLSAVFFFLFFSKLSFSSKAVNYIAQSVFAVYLLHCNGHILPLFKKTCLSLYLGNGTAAYAWKICAFILAVFFSAVIIDQIRKFIWEKAEKYF